MGEGGVNFNEEKGGEAGLESMCVGQGLTHNLGNNSCKFNVNSAQYKITYSVFCLQNTAALKRLGHLQLEKCTAMPTNVVHTRKAINSGAL